MKKKWIAALGGLAAAAGVGAYLVKKKRETVRGNHTEPASRRKRDTHLTPAFARAKPHDNEEY